MIAAKSVGVSDLDVMQLSDLKHTNPTAMREEPVFQPVRLNWLENQYSGKLYLFQVLAL